MKNILPPLSLKLSITSAHPSIILRNFSGVIPIRPFTWNGALNRPLELYRTRPLYEVRVSQKNVIVLSIGKSLFAIHALYKVYRTLCIYSFSRLYLYQLFLFQEILSLRYIQGFRHNDEIIFAINSYLDNYLSKTFIPRISFSFQEISGILLDYYFGY